MDNSYVRVQLIYSFIHVTHYALYLHISYKTFCKHQRLSSSQKLLKDDDYFYAMLLSLNDLCSLAEKITYSVAGCVMKNSPYILLLDDISYSGQSCASCSHLCASVTKQYNLVPAKGR